MTCFLKGALRVHLIGLSHCSASLGKMEECGFWLVVKQWTDYWNNTRGVIEAHVTHRLLCFLYTWRRPIIISLQVPREVSVGIVGAVSHLFFLVLIALHCLLSLSYCIYSQLV